MKEDRSGTIFFINIDVITTLMKVKIAVDLA